jgi:hypothetical protein
MCLGRDKYRATTPKVVLAFVRPGLESESVPRMEVEVINCGRFRLWALMVPRCFMHAIHDVTPGLRSVRPVEKRSFTLQSPLYLLGPGPFAEPV